MVKVTDDAILKSAGWLWSQGIDVGEFELMGDVVNSPGQMVKLRPFRRAVEMALELSELANTMENGS